MRLIDADALKKDIEENAIVLGGVQSIEVECAKALIDNTPTVNDCPNCEYKLEADYIRSSSSYKELIDLRKFKEENIRPQGECIEVKHRLNLLIGVLYTNQLISESDLKYIEDSIKKLMKGGAENDA